LPDLRNLCCTSALAGHPALCALLHAIATKHPSQWTKAHCHVTWLAGSSQMPWVGWVASSCARLRTSDPMVGASARAAPATRWPLSSCLECGPGPAPSPMGLCAGAARSPPVGMQAGEQPVTACVLLCCGVAVQGSQLPGPEWWRLRGTWGTWYMACGCGTWVRGPCGSCARRCGGCPPHFAAGC
jgi:hypothetical protein